MRNRTVVLSLLALCLGLCTFASAADSGYLFIVHGVPGRDVSASLDPTLPVDILINDDVCTERGMTYGSMLGPLTLPAAQYNIKISPANSLLPCSNSPMLDSNVTVAAGEDVSEIFALNSKGNPSLVHFANNFASVAENEVRVVLTNSADAPELQITLLGLNSNKKYTFNVEPGQKVGPILPADEYTIEVAANNSVLVPPQAFILPSRSTTLVYATGNATNGSLSLITKIVRDVL